MNNMNENFDVFDDYAMKYDFNNFDILRKYEHSYRVMRESDNIVYSLELEEDDSFLASFIGLFHDIGRFEQLSKYNTFDDKKSFDHAQKAVDVLFKDGLVNKTNLNENDYELVKLAILNHNKFEIDKGINDEKILLHSKIVRDSDKIDILYQLSNPRIIKIESDESEISLKVKDTFKKHKSIDLNDIKTINDRVVSVISLVFDLNFDYSKELILEKEYLNRLLECVNKDILESYVDEAIKYLKGSVK